MKDLLEEGEEKAVYLGLVDVLYAYAYNYRVSEGESNVSYSTFLSNCCFTLQQMEIYDCLPDNRVLACYG